MTRWGDVPDDLFMQLTKRSPKDMPLPMPYFVASSFSPLQFHAVTMFPGGWGVKVDAASGRPYYWLVENGMSVHNSIGWEHPGNCRQPTLATCEEIVQEEFLLVHAAGPLLSPLDAME